MVVALMIALAGAFLGACGGNADRPVAASAPTTTTTTTTTTAVRPTTDRDGLVATPDGRLHLRCVGEGATTVVLVAGWGDAGDSWGTIESALRDDARVCSYARLGTGDSDPPAGDQTFTTQAASLDELLTAAGEVGPYVLVGHSFGGAVSVAFAAEHGDDVVGLALLDATPLGWIDAACAVPADGTAGAAMFVATCAMGSDPATNPERVDAARAFREVASITDLGDVPMSVLYPRVATYGDLSATEQERLRAVKSDGMRRWASLSSKGKVIPVDGTGHYLQTDRPDAVIAAIEGLLP
jgi:pimeloyl-ACP methyl ester carboxylesterase